jgi:hypothetical protein
LFFLPTRLVGIVRWSKTPSSSRVVRAVFIWQQLGCPSMAALFVQYLPQQGGAILFWMLPSVPEITSGSTICPALRSWPIVPSHSQPLCFSCSLLGAGGYFGLFACHPTPALLSDFIPLPISSGHQWLLWDIGLSPCSHSQTLLLYICVRSLRVRHREFNSLLHPCSPRKVILLFFGCTGAWTQRLLFARLC